MRLFFSVFIENCVCFKRWLTCLWEKPMPVGSARPIRDGLGFSDNCVPLSEVHSSCLSFSYASSVQCFSLLLILHARNYESSFIHLSSTFGAPISENQSCPISQSPPQPQWHASSVYLRNSLRKYRVVAAMTVRCKWSLHPHSAKILPKHLPELSPCPQSRLTSSR